MEQKIWECKDYAPILNDDSGAMSAIQSVSTRLPFQELIKSNHFNQESISKKERNCLIICNSLIPLDTLEYLWSKSILVICADGGANRLYNLLLEKGEGVMKQYVPDYIKGDLDSLDQQVRDYYNDLGSTIIQDKSQDSTDLQKAMILITDIERTYSFKFSNIYIGGGLGGNISHEFANLSVLYEYSLRNLILFSNGNVAWLLNSLYSHVIKLKSDMNCSLVPLASTAEHVTTTGLKWNLSNNSLKFGELISTSNLSQDPIITCTTNSHLIFIIDLIH